MRSVPHRLQQGVHPVERASEVACGKDSAGAPRAALPVLEAAVARAAPVEAEEVALAEKVAHSRRRDLARDEVSR